MDTAGICPGRSGSILGEGSAGKGDVHTCYYAITRLCFSPGDKEVADLLKMAQKQKNKMVREINAKAAKYAIKLDRDDRLIMGPAECAVGKGEQPQPEVELDRMVSEEADQAGAEPERQESEENYAVQGHMEETTSEAGRQEYAQEKPWTPQASALDDPEAY